MHAALTLEVENLAATETFGRRLGALLFPGAVVALIGPLGAGKTHLVRAIAEGQEIPDSRVVSSPTFVLIQEYPARLPIFHFDAYRLTGPDEFRDLGVHEYYEAGGVCLIEWADRIGVALPVERLGIRIAISGESSRRFEVEGIGVRYAELLSALLLSGTPSR